MVNSGYGFNFVVVNSVIYIGIFVVFFIVLKVFGIFIKKFFVIGCFLVLNDVKFVEN